MKLIATIISLLVITGAAHAAGNEGIAVVVNSDAITNSDVDERMKMIAASTGIANNPDMMDKLRPQIIDMLVDEELKMQEARALKIKVSKAEIDGGFEEIAKNNNIPAEQFRQMIEKSGIRMSTMNDQIEAQIAWGKVVAAKIRPKVEVSDSDIDSEIDKLKAKMGQAQYRVAQIYLPVNDAGKEKDIVNFATKLVAQLRQQPEAFGKAAQQFSQAPGAKKGGDMGWIEKGQMPSEVDAVLDTLGPNQISDPIKSQNAYYILTVNEKRQMTEDMLPKREEILQRIGLQRMERAARRYMLDLRSSAFIETRV
ncbi:MAG: rotamase [Micavibrio aeruginosavorus]|uniref:Rotamase n=1 Tax=Micavibrio aeruginosavorus TaxID=349221 RepID=A0A2W5HQG0_9BACT|nr:MAG: rotamase [Micavibrio aeruginosavorus]